MLISGRSCLHLVFLLFTGDDVTTVAVMDRDDGRLLGLLVSHVVVWGLLCRGGCRFGNDVVSASCTVIFCCLGLEVDGRLKADYAEEVLKGCKI